MLAVRATKRSLPLVLVVALLVVQMLGLAHRVVHAGHGQDASARLADDGRHRVMQSPEAQDFWTAVFSGHTGQRDCDAYDQMSHADLAIATYFAVASEPPVAMTVIFHRAWHIAAQARGFLARGPPTVA